MADYRASVGSPRKAVGQVRITLCARRGMTYRSGRVKSWFKTRVCCSEKPPASPDVRLPAVLSWHATAPRLSGCRAVEQSVSRNLSSRIHCASSIFTQTDFAELGLRIQICRSRGKMARESLGRMSGRIDSSSQTDVCRFLEHPLRVRRRTASIVS
jgi:hypothetical protein